MAATGDHNDTQPSSSPPPSPSPSPLPPSPPPPAVDLTARRSPRFESQCDDDDDDDVKLTPSQKSSTKQSNGGKRTTRSKPSSFLIGDPIPDDEARQRWPYRYQINLNKRQKTDRGSSNSNDDDEDELVLDVKCHYSQAQVVKCVFDLGDCAYVKGEKGKKNYVGRIVEFFKTMDDEDYVRVQWFYRAEDTVKIDGASNWFV